MIKININASSRYDVLIEPGILQKCGEYISDLEKQYDKIAIISDCKVYSIYGKIVHDSLTATGIPVVDYVFENGEKSKNLSVLEDAANFLSENKITRKSLIIALGGGVTGDLAGFLAAVFHRGIDYIQAPTTLLSMIDSSVGGKTAVNIRSGKNILGSFYQPKMVLCDINTLSTLDEEVFNDGVAEAIKYGCICDQGLFELLDSNDMHCKIEEIIAKCVSIKALIVGEDEYENGKRAILNFGHTLGHGIEKLSDFTVTHGKAVAIGMVLAAKAGEANGITPCGTARQIESALKRYNLPVESSYPLSEICAQSLNDKKRSGNSINLILLAKLGEACIYPVNAEKLYTFTSCFAGGKC